MKVVIAAAIAAAVGLIAAGTLGVATAEAPTGSQPRTVNVQGVASEAIDQHANSSVASTVYRQGMTDAVSDGAGKARFLAAKVGGVLGAPQTVIEEGGYITCGEAEYLGEQPDFGSPGVSLPAVTHSVAGATSAPVVRRKRPVKRGHHAPAAKKANVPTCTLSTRVSLAYTLG
jgi:hypothetical protein